MRQQQKELENARTSEKQARANEERSKLLLVKQQRELDELTFQLETIKYNHKHSTQNSNQIKQLEEEIVTYKNGNAKIREGYAKAMKKSEEYAKAMIKQQEKELENTRTSEKQARDNEERSKLLLIKQQKELDELTFQLEIIKCNHKHSPQNSNRIKQLEEEIVTYKNGNDKMTKLVEKYMGLYKNEKLKREIVENQMTELRGRCERHDQELKRRDDFITELTSKIDTNDDDDIASGKINSKQKDIFIEEIL